MLLFTNYRLFIMAGVGYENEVGWDQSLQYDAKKSSFKQWVTGSDLCFKKLL